MSVRGGEECPMELHLLLRKKIVLFKWMLPVKFVIVCHSVIFKNDLCLVIVELCNLYSGDNTQYKQEAKEIFELAIFHANIIHYAPNKHKFTLQPTGLFMPTLAVTGYRAKSSPTSLSCRAAFVAKESTRRAWSKNTVQVETLESVTLPELQDPSFFAEKIEMFRIAAASDHLTMLSFVPSLPQVHQTLFLAKNGIEGRRRLTFPNQVCEGFIPPLPEYRHSNPRPMGMGEEHALHDYNAVRLLTATISAEEPTLVAIQKLFEHFVIDPSTKKMCVTYLDSIGAVQRLIVVQSGN
ncbi:MAG: hypothetical protein S4CHLAM102_12810 [Chlamydiia bacterium]|nr:hypothetical protein [Chlamydiia bacterium]